MCYICTVPMAEKVFVAAINAVHNLVAIHYEDATSKDNDGVLNVTISSSATEENGRF